MNERSSELKFKEGDRVRVTWVWREPGFADAEWIEVGQVYTIQPSATVTFNSEFPYKVRRNDDPRGDYDYLCESQLELVTTPTVYKLTVPPEPEDVDRVRPTGRSGTEYKRSGRHWECDGIRYTWRELLDTWFERGLEPVPAESEYDVAVRFFQENPTNKYVTGGGWISRDAPHASAIVRKVLADIDAGVS